MKDIKQALYTYKVRRVVRVVDADTLLLEIDLGFYTYHISRVQLARIDAPEIFGVSKDSDEYKAGLKAKVFVENWLKAAKELYIKTYRDTKGKYGRYLVEVYNDKGECLNDILVEKGLARRV